MTGKAAAAATAPPPRKPYPSAAAGWFLVVMLTIAYIFSFVDRYILGLLIEPIKAEFGLTDRSIGWLLSAFTLVYGFVGIFMGWLIDRGKRIWIVSIGVALWSAATIATGTAKNFVQLFAARMGVGVGEATLESGDLLDDRRQLSDRETRQADCLLFVRPADRRRTGILAERRNHCLDRLRAAARPCPFSATCRRGASRLIVVGLPGLIFAAFFLLMKEPARRPAAGIIRRDRRQRLHRRPALYLAATGLLYLGFLLIIGTMTAIAYSQGFLAPTFERTWGWSPQKYAYDQRRRPAGHRPGQHAAHGHDLRLVDQKGRERRIACGSSISVSSSWFRPARCRCSCPRPNWPSRSCASTPSASASSPPSASPRCW